MLTRRNGNLIGRLFALTLFAAIFGVGLLIFDALTTTPDTDTSTATATPRYADPALGVMATAAPVDSPADAELASAQTVQLPGTFPLDGAQIVIPSIAVNSPIIQVYLSGNSWDVDSLGLNVGHLQGTTWLSGRPGNIVLSGHVEMGDGRRGVFTNLGELEDGALIILQQGDTERRYIVTEKSVVTPDNLDPVRPTSDERLTLITCDDYDFFSDAYATRTVIVAEPIN
ncbi:MAG: sortase [Anaerolineaceae bacterium]|nr:MAG: sortase [Anaerolineaceae bacterium]